MPRLVVVPVLLPRVRRSSPGSVERADSGPGPSAPAATEPRPHPAPRAPPNLERAPHRVLTPAAMVLLVPHLHHLPLLLHLVVVVVLMLCRARNNLEKKAYFLFHSKTSLYDLDLAGAKMCPAGIGKKYKITVADSIADD